MTAGVVGVTAGAGADVGVPTGGVRGTEGVDESPLPVAAWSVWSVLSPSPLSFASSSSGSATTSINEGGGGVVVGTVASEVGALVVVDDGAPVVVDTAGGEVGDLEGVILDLEDEDDDDDDVDDEDEDDAVVGFVVLEVDDDEGLLVRVVSAVGLNDGCDVEDDDSDSESDSDDDDDDDDDSEGVVGCVVGATELPVAMVNGQTRVRRMGMRGHKCEKRVGRGCVARRKGRKA